MTSSSPLGMTAADHALLVDEGCGVNKSRPTMYACNAVLNAARIASVAAGINSVRVCELQMAAAAKPPAQGPTTHVVRADGYGSPPLP